MRVWQPTRGLMFFWEGRGSRYLWVRTSNRTAFVPEQRMEKMTRGLQEAGLTWATMDFEIWIGDVSGGGDARHHAVWAARFDSWEEAAQVFSILLKQAGVHDNEMWESAEISWPDAMAQPRAMAKA